MNRVRYLFGIMLCSFGILNISSGQTQVNCIHYFKYRVQERMEISIPVGLQYDSVPDYILGYSKPYVTNSTVGYCFDDSLKLTTTILYEEPLVLDTWVQPIKKTVVNENGYRIYTDGDSLLYSHVYPDSLKDAEHEYHIDSLDNFGFIPIFERPDSADITDLQDSGYVVQALDNDIYYIRLNESEEQVINFSTQMIVTNILSEGIILEQSIQYHIPTSSEHMLRVKEENIQYKQFPKGEWLKLKTSKIYYNYTLNGDTLLVDTSNYQSIQNTGELTEETTPSAK